MLLTEFLDSAANTEQEARLFEELAKIDDLANIKDGLAQATKIPFVGKLIKALVALYDYGSIEAFKQSEYYPDIEGWDCYIDLDKGHISIYPGAEQRKKIFKVMAIIGAGLLFLWLCRRYRRRNKK